MNNIIKLLAVMILLFTLPRGIFGQCNQWVTKTQQNGIEVSVIEPPLMINGGEHDIAIAGLYDGESYYLDLDVGICVDNTSRLQILFENGQKINGVNLQGTNCDGAFRLRFNNTGRQFLKLQLLVDSNIYEIRLAGYRESFELLLDDNMKDKVRAAFSCLVN